MSRKMLAVLILILLVVVVLVSSHSGSVDVNFITWTIIRVPTAFALLGATVTGVIIGVLLK